MRTLQPALLASLALLAVSAALLLMPSETAAQSPTQVAIDADPSGNSGGALGTRDGCVSVSSGDTFQVDVTIANVDLLIAWELYIRVDPSVLEVVDADMYQFLGKNPRSSLTLLSVPFADGRHFIGAAETKGYAESGAGVLARVTLQAKSSGLSPLDVPYADFDGDGTIDIGPRLTNSAGDAIGDLTGDGVFDGPTFHAFVAVDRACGAIIPTPTLPFPPDEQPPDGASPAEQPPSRSGDRPVVSPAGDLPAPAERALASQNTPGNPADDDDEATGGEGDTGDTGSGSSANPANPNADDEDEQDTQPVALGRDSTPEGAANRPGPSSSGGSAGSTSSGDGLPLWAIGSIALGVLVASAGAAVFLAGRLGNRYGL